MSVAGERFHSPGLTGLRALAAGWVLLFHLNAIVGPRRLYLDLGFHRFEVTHLATIGWIGVYLFFVLSGFLLTTHLLESAAREPWPRILPRYFKARIARVFPAYWAQILILIAVALAATGAWPDWMRFLPLHAFMLHNLLEEASFAINPVYWTLPIELGFYIVLPLAARRLAVLEGAPGRRWIALAAMLAAAILMTWAYRYAVFRMYEGSRINTLVWAMSQLPGSFDQFAAGVVTAAGFRWWRESHPPLSPRARDTLSTLLLAAGLAGVIAMMYLLHRVHLQYWQGHWSLFAGHTAIALCVATMVLAIALSGPLTRFAFENRVVMFLGTVSYSVYLWHLPIAQWLAHWLDMRNLDLRSFLLLAVPPIVLASACSYYLVERPFIRRAGADSARARLL